MVRHTLFFILSLELFILLLFLFVVFVCVLWVGCCGRRVKFLFKYISKYWVPVFYGKRYELGRQPAMTKLSSNKTVRRVRVRGGNVKWRALRLDTGNYSWGSEAVTRKTRILDVVYNASNNELVRTQTLVKSAIVQVDAAPFKQWYLQHYGVDIGRKKKGAAAKKEGEVFLVFLAWSFLLLILYLWLFGCWKGLRTKLPC